MNTAARPSWKTANLDSPLPAVILSCLVAAGCYQAAGLASVLGIPPDHIASFWPATPFLVAVLLLTPKRIWPALMAAGLGAMALRDFESGMPIGGAIWASVGNTVEALVAMLGISLLFKGLPHLSSVKSFAKYFAVFVILAPSVSALVGAIAASARGAYWLQWRIWFFADALAFLTVTPAIVTWVREGRSWARKSHNYLELAALMSSLVLFGYLAFMGTGRREPPALLYSLVPILLWAALRLGLKGVSTSMVIVAFMSTWGSAHDRGPFTGQGPLNNVLSLQLFLFFAAIPFMVLAVLVEEHRLAQQTLIDEQAQLTEAQRLAEFGSWRWDLRTDAVAWSQELYRMAGYNPALPPPSFKNHNQFFTPESWDRLNQAVDRALRTGAPYELDLEALRPDGTRLWVTSRGEAVCDGGGRPIQLRGTIQNITERKLAAESLEELSGRLITAQDEERTRIARELHDDFSQRLALQGIGLEQLWKKLPESEVEERAKVQELMKGIQEISSDMHSLSHQLHSSRLELVGLVSALDGLCKEMGETFEIEIHFAKSGSLPKISKDVELCLFRVTQEALGNVVKHSYSKRAQVEVGANSQGVSLRITDAGRGFEPDLGKPAAGIGLVGMRERLRLVGGRLSVKSGLMRGTEILAEVPLASTTGHGTSEQRHHKARA
jgi:PAS domain S-box-containing protein